MKNSIFFICKSTDAKCYVYSTFITLKRKYSLNFIKAIKYLLLDSWFESFTYAIEYFNINKSNNSHLILFAFPDEDFPILRSIQPNRYITSDWFDINLKDTLIILFCPRGAKMLRDNNWMSKINNWVSFEDKFNFIGGLPIGDRELKRIIPEISKEVNKIATSKEATLIIDKIFNQSMDRLYLENNKIDDIIFTIIKLKLNKENLVNNNDLL
jgi:hypothetical protein